MMNITNRIDKLSIAYLYRDEGCTEKFVKEFSWIKEEIEKRIRENKPMEEATEWQKMEFKNATKWSICNLYFKEGDERIWVIIVIFLLNTVDIPIINIIWLFTQIL